MATKCRIYSALLCKHLTTEIATTPHSPYCILRFPVLILDRPVSRLGCTIPILRSGPRKCPQLQSGDSSIDTGPSVWRLGHKWNLPQWTPYCNSPSINTGCLVSILDMSSLDTGHLQYWYLMYQTSSINTGCPVLILDVRFLHHQKIQEDTKLIHRCHKVEVPSL